MVTHYITDDDGRVQCSCSVNTKDTYNWLLRFGYYPSKTYSEDEPYIFTAGNFIYSSNNPYIVNIECGTYDSLYGVWCGNDVEMFKAIAALKNKNDKFQYFVIDTNLWNPFTDGQNTTSKGTFVLCHKDRWAIDINDDGTPCEFSSRNIPAHKATVTEIINHFLNNATEVNVHTISL